MRRWGSNDFGFKLNYQSILPADQNAGLEPAVRPRCAVESLYKWTAEHIAGNNVYLCVSAQCCRVQTDPVRSALVCK